MRLDKFLSEKNIGSRSEVKSILRKGLVRVNGIIVTDAATSVNPEVDEVTYKGTKYCGSTYSYYMLNKPAGLISATEDDKVTNDSCVLSLFRNEPCRDLFPVGRLDKDTTGLLIITNDGALAHELLSPRKHVDKTYLVTCMDEISNTACQKLEAGVDIGDAKITLPAKVERLSDKELKITIQEGRYHQIKRMLSAVDHCVVALKRLSMGSLFLDESLKEGEFRELTKQEISLLQMKGKEL